MAAAVSGGGILLHFCHTGMFNGMPDLTIIRAYRDQERTDPIIVEQPDEALPEEERLKHWPLRECTIGGGELVRVPLAQMEKMEKISGQMGALAVATLRSLEGSEVPVELP